MAILPQEQKSQKIVELEIEVSKLERQAGGKILSATVQKL